MGIGFSRVLVGYDGSPAAQRALEETCEAMPADGLVIVVHAYDVPWEAKAYPWFADYKKSCRRVADEVLDEARNLCRPFPVAARFVASEGKPVDVLTEVARTRNVSLIVVGTRSLGAVRGAIGSTTYKLLHSASCAVLVIPDPELGADEEAGARERQDERPQLAEARR